MTKAPIKASTKKDAKYYEQKAATLRGIEEQQSSIRKAKEALKKLRGK